MKKTLLRIILLNLFAAAMLAVTPSAFAKDESSTNAAAATKHKKHDHLVFNGKLSAVDTNAMTFTVGKRTFDVTSDTKITRDGKPATLVDGVVGENVGGAYIKCAGEKLTATTVHFGAKADSGKKPKKKKSGQEDSGSATNSVPN